MTTPTNYIITSKARRRCSNSISESDSTRNISAALVRDSPTSSSEFAPPSPAPEHQHDHRHHQAAAAAAAITNNNEKKSSNTQIITSQVVVVQQHPNNNNNNKGQQQQQQQLDELNYIGIIRPPSSPSTSTSSSTSTAKINPRKCAATSKLKKAPDAPRRFKSAYIFFSAEKHKDIRAQLGDQGLREKTGTISKLVSEAWRELSPEERSKWEAMARNDRARYDVEKTMFKGPWHVPRKRKSKDVNAPKRPMSAFLAFANSRRGAVKRERPDTSNGEISRSLATMWKEAPSEVRQRYIDEEHVQRRHYLAAISEWRTKTEEEKRTERKRREEKALRLVKEMQADGSHSSMKQVDDYSSRAADSAADDDDDDDHDAMNRESPLSYYSSQRGMHSEYSASQIQGRGGYSLVGTSMPLDDSHTLNRRQRDDATLHSTGTVNSEQQPPASVFGVRNDFAACARDKSSRTIDGGMHQDNVTLTGCSSGATSGFNPYYVYPPVMHDFGNHHNYMYNYYSPAATTTTTKTAYAAAPHAFPIESAGHPGITDPNADRYCPNNYNYSQGPPSPGRVPQHHHASYYYTGWGGFSNYYWGDFFDAR